MTIMRKYRGSSEKTSVSKERLTPENMPPDCPSHLRVFFSGKKSSGDVAMVNKIFATG